MKTLMICLTLFLSSQLFAQKHKSQTIQIQTSAQCGDCKNRIENALNYTKGISYAELNMETKKVEIKFNPKKTDYDKIKAILSKIGYDADDQKADQQAVLALPKCCQPGGH